MITYIEDKSPKYPPRTYANASADATIAFAFDFGTPGELLTKDAVEKQGKLYIQVFPSFVNSLKIKNVATFVSDAKVKTINIAGNSLPIIIKNNFTQLYCDTFVHEFMKLLINHPIFDCNIQIIRSGGQSGFDEAGIKAAIKLGIPALIHCPKGFKFINEHGETICDEVLFKRRFEI